MRIEFEGQTVLVTGATRGIGKCLADDFANLGANLLLTGTRPEQIESLNRSARETGEKKSYYCVDFLNPQSTDSFLEALAQHDKIDVCVNNAGINRINYIHETRLKDLDDIVEVNLKAPFRVIRQISSVMKENRYGRIVNISSVWGVISKEKRSIYSSTKFGIRGLTVAASNELARHNILVNSVSPGFVLTELTRQILNEEEMAFFAGQVPVGRLASPEEISRVVLFFTSRLNTYVTGQNIVVDGGFVNV